MALAAQLPAAFMRVVCMVSACMVGSFAVAYSYCARSARISRVSMMALRSGGAHDSRRWHRICTPRMIGWERIDMCSTVVPYEYMSVGDVLNGLIYLILSSPTRVMVDAVWRVLRPFKDG